MSNKFGKLDFDCWEECILSISQTVLTEPLDIGVSTFFK